MLGRDNRRTLDQGYLRFRMLARRLAAYLPGRSFILTPLGCIDVIGFRPGRLAAVNDNETP